MTPDRLKQLNALHNNVRSIEQELTRRERASEDLEWGNQHVSKSALQRVAKIIEQDLEEQLAVAKRAFEAAA